MISLVYRLSIEFPEKNLIYRSHPSEGDDLYKTIFKGLDNVKITHEGSICPWLLAAETIIHDGCTTAVEASFSNGQIINYKTSENENYDIRLPNLVGVKATTQEAVIELVKCPETKPINPSAFRELDEMIANYHLDSFSELSEVIEEKIESMDNSMTEAPRKPALRYECNKHLLKASWKKATSKKRRKSKEYAEKKFPGFDLNVIQNQICNAEKLTGTKINLVYADPLMIVLESGDK